MDKENKGFEFVQSEIPYYLNECCFGDDYIFYEGEDGHPKYENISEKWDEFGQWLGKVRERNKAIEGFEDSLADRVGQEVMKWIEMHDTFAIYLLTKTYWEAFRDTYLLVDDCPDIVMEFIRAIMYEKMTEKQMWGTKEDRMPEGKLIIFDKDYLPKEGEDTGKWEIIYQPIETEPFDLSEFATIQSQTNL